MPSRLAAGRGWAPSTALLAVLMLVGIVPLALFVARAIAQGGELTGATGVFPADQFQYLAWVRDAGTHGLASSLFDLVPARHVLLDPLFATSGLLWRLGVPIQLAYLAWLPIGVAVLFGGFHAYVRRTLPQSLLDRTGALALALLAATPLLPALVWTSGIGPGSSGDFFLQSVDTTPALQLWGYFPIAISLGLMAYALLWSERALEDGQARRNLWRASGAALLVGWLHPWQGATLILVLLAVAAMGRPLTRYARLLLPAAAAAVPLGYYALLPHLDSAWALARDQNVMGVSWNIALGSIGPLLLLAAGRPRLSGLSVQGRILVIWPIAAVCVYASGVPYPAHALETVSLPLAVLAMRGWHFLPARKVILTGAIALLTLPGLVYAGLELHTSVDQRPAAYVLAGDDARALRFIADSPVPGGVLAPMPQALAVPGMTGRRTWIGHPSWTTAFDFRIAEVTSLFDGLMTTRAARHRVKRIAAPFVLATCATSQKLLAQIAPIAIAERRFGCATVFQLARSTAQAAP